MTDTAYELAPQHKQGLTLVRPLLNAAGTLGFAGEARGLVDLQTLGGFVTNPLTWSPRTPAAPPNAVALAEGVLIHTGLPNPGVRAAVRDYGREWRRLGRPVIAHLAATTPDDVGRSLEVLERAEVVAGVELGLRDDIAAGEVRALVRAARGGPPLLVRLPLDQAPALAEAAVAAGADALTVAAPARGQAEADGRTVTGRLYGLGQFEPALAALQAVLALGLGVPVMGAGGVFAAEQARRMLVAGAAAVQVDAVLWRTPDAISSWRWD